MEKYPEIQLSIVKDFVGIEQYLKEVEFGSNIWVFESWEKREIVDGYKFWTEN